VEISPVEELRPDWRLPTIDPTADEMTADRSSVRLDPEALVADQLLPGGRVCDNRRVGLPRS